ncbi:MAG TPA: hypothetical protein VNQ52_02655 [Microbacteriaceae bacterium]|nr:hypothetical protein [Microbacteriaceae bacterium]
MDGAVERLGVELEDLTARIAQRIVEQVPEYQVDAVARQMLVPFLRQNADEVMRVLRGIETTTAAARNVALVDAVATDLSLDAVERTYAIARDAFADRLRALAADDEDLAGPLARLDEAYVMVLEAIRDEYRAAKERLERE